MELSFDPIPKSEQERHLCKKFNADWEEENHVLEF
jgi:hypothetical protein